MNHNQRLGKLGEDLAVRCLADRGIEVIERNWRCARGEIDIVASDAGTLVFCEVKTRSSAAFGQPVDAVVGVKAARLRGLGSQWLSAHPGSWPEIRFDVVSVMVDGYGPARIAHVRGAF